MTYKDRGWVGYLRLKRASLQTALFFSSFLLFFFFFGGGGVGGDYLLLLSFLVVVCLKTKEKKRHAHLFNELLKFVKEPNLDFRVSAPKQAL